MGRIGLNQCVLQDNIQPTALWIAGEKNSFAQGTAGAILKKPKALEVCVTHHPKAVLYSASGVRSFFRSGKKGRSIPKDTRQNRTNR